MQHPIATETVGSIAQLIEVVQNFELTSPNNRLYFRGENQDYGTGAFTPGIYRTPQQLASEHRIYREMQRFNDHEFVADKTAFDKLSRMQHYQAPTRLLDLSEDVLSALYFALEGRQANSRAAIYLIEIDEQQVKYYDSDAVSVVANLAKSPLSNDAIAQKSKQALQSDAVQLKSNIQAFNQTDSVSFLLHDIKEEKSYFSHKIDPKHLLSILFVKPKLTNDRLHGQKGAYLLFGLNQNDLHRAIPVIDSHQGELYLNGQLDRSQLPIVKMTKVILSNDIDMEHLERLGVTRPYIYPEMDRVAGYLGSVRKVLA